MGRLLLRLATDGQVFEALSLTKLIRLPASDGVVYALVDSESGVRPPGLTLRRQGSDLQFEVDGEPWVVLEGFYAPEIAPLVALDGPPTPAAELQAAAAVEENGDRDGSEGVVWRAGEDAGEGASEGAPVLGSLFVGLAGLGLALSSGGGGGKDVTPPVVPTFELSAESDSGLSAADRLTQNTTPTFTGTAEPGTTVEVRANEESLGTTVVGDDGTWRFTVPDAKALGGGERAIAYAMTATATDEAGNRSEAAALEVTVDDLAPVFTSDAAPAVDENRGDALVLTAAATDDGAVAFRLKADNDDNADAFTIDTTTGVVTLVTPDLNHEDRSVFSFTVVATDAAGNVSEQAVTLSINDLDESQPVITSAEDASVPENLGENQVVYTVTATDTADLDDTTDTSDALSYALKADNDDDAAAFTIDSATGAVTLTGNPDFETKASYSFTVVATDSGANTAEQTVTLIVNDQPPVATMDAAVLQSSKSQSVTSSEKGTAFLVADSLTVNRVTDITGAADDQWNQVEITAADTATDLSLSGLAEGDYRLYAADEGGALSAATSTLVTVDDTAPSVVFVATDDFGPVTGELADGAVTDDASLVLSGTTEAGASIDVFNGDTRLGAATVTDTTWTYTAALVDGTDYRFNIKATDLAGNVSEASPELTITSDLTPPGALALALTSDTGISDTDGLTNDARLTLSGAEDGAEIEYSTDGGTTWSTSFSPADGEISVIARQTNGAGSRSPASAPLSFTLDSAAPTVTITAVAYDADANTLTLTGANFGTITDDGTADGDDVRSRLDWSKIQWDVDGDGANPVTFTADDAASAVASAADTLTITLTEEKATALEGEAGFDPFDDNDTLALSAGFTRDGAGNASSTDAFEGPDALATDVVVFDLVLGVSSSHSERTFQEDVDYTIYVRVDSDSPSLNMTPEEMSVAEGATWGLWSGAENLGAGDRIIFVGDESDGALPGSGDAAISRSINNRFALEFFNSPFNPSAFSTPAAALRISDIGRLERGKNFARLSADLWIGVVPNMAALAGTKLTSNVLNTLPAGILTSQGLV